MRVPCAEFGAGVVRAKGQDAVRLRLGGRHELKANRVADSDDDVRGTGGSSSGARPGSNAINAAIEAIAKRQNRILLVTAIGTGKTYTAFQIIWRLWKAGRKKRILFLADRNVLVDQTMVNDFRPFGRCYGETEHGGEDH